MNEFWHATTKSQLRELLFRISVTLKGLHAALEIVGGIALLVVSPDLILRAMELFTQDEIAEDPRDLIANYLLDAARHLSLGSHGSEVRRLADDRLFLRRAFADQIADDHEPGGDPDTRLELDGFDIEATDSVGPPARHRPHALPGSRNRPKHRRPCTWRQVVGAVLF
jgi:hypothetical protein